MESTSLVTCFGGCCLIVSALWRVRYGYVYMIQYIGYRVLPTPCQLRADWCVVFSKTGLVVVEKTDSQELQDYANSLSGSGAEYEMLSAQRLRAKYPCFAFDDSFSAVFDPSAGILRADKCLAAFQVRLRPIITDSYRRRRRYLPHCVYTIFN